MLVNYFGSLLLQDMFLNLQVFAFEGQNMTYTVNVLLTCILNCDAGPGYDIELFASTIDRLLARVSYLPSHAFLRRHVALLRVSYTLAKRNSHVSCSYLIELLFLELDV